MNYTAPPNTSIVRLTGMMGTFLRTQALEAEDKGAGFAGADSAGLTPGVYRTTTIRAGLPWLVKYLHVAENGEVAEVSEDALPELLKEAEE